MSEFCPPAIRRPQRRPQGGGRGHAPAHPGAAGRGRADGLRPHRDPRQSQPRISRHLKLLAEAGLVERFREGAWAFFRLAERGGSAELARALVARLDPEDPMIARDRERLAAVRRGARRRGAGLFPRARRAMGPHPQAACRRRGGRGRDPRGARRPAVPLAARSRHRHRPHAGTVRPRARARARHRPVARHAAAGARAARARRPAPLQRAAGRHLRSRGAGGLVRRRHHPSGAALPRRRRARDPRGGARAARRAAGCWWSTSRRTISNSCARSTPIAASASPPRP